VLVVRSSLLGMLSGDMKVNMRIFASSFKDRLASCFMP